MLYKVAFNYSENQEGAPLLQFILSKCRRMPSRQTRDNWSQTGLQKVLSKHHEAVLYSVGDRATGTGFPKRLRSCLFGDLQNLSGCGPEHCDPLLEKD